MVQRRALLTGVVLVALAAGAATDAGASEPIRYHYVATGVGGDVAEAVAAQSTPAGHVAPGDFSVRAEGTSITVEVADALPAGTPIGLSVGHHRLCLPNTTSATLGGFRHGDTVPVSVTNYVDSCFGVAFVDGTSGTLTVWP